MFQLIIAVISIALISALAIASIFYGGSAFNKGNMQSAVSTLVNGGQQIAGAQALYRTDYLGANGTTAGLASGGYLTQTPATSSIVAPTSVWTVPSGAVAAGVVQLVTVPLLAASSDAACTEVYNQAGTARPTTLPTAASGITGQFGCYGSGTTLNFGFKY